MAKSLNLGTFWYKNLLKVGFLVSSMITVFYSNNNFHLLTSCQICDEFIHMIRILIPHEQPS